MNKFFSVLILVTLACLASSAGYGQSGTTEVKVNDGNVSVEADRLDIDENIRRAVFSGAVHVVQDDFDLRSDKMVVEYGPGGPQDLTTMTATIGVVINMDEAIATGNQAIYDARSDILVVSGNATYKNGANTLTGSTLTINFDTGTTNMVGGSQSSGSGGRVTGLFSPKSN